MFTCDTGLVAPRIWCCHAVLGSNDKSTAARNCANRSPPLHRTFPKYVGRSIADGISLGEIGKAPDIVNLVQRPKRPCFVSNTQQKRVFKNNQQYQSVMSAPELTPGARNSNPGRRKFGRICQRFWFAHCCGSRRLQSESSVPVASCAIRVGIFCR